MTHTITALCTREGDCVEVCRERSYYSRPERGSGLGYAFLD